MIETVTGQVTGTGAAINVSIGFIPSYVKVFNPNDAGSLYATLEWWNGMAAASGLKTMKVVDSGATGNASSNYVTSGGISTYAGGAPPVTMSGTVAVSANSPVVTGTSTHFTTECAVRQVINIGGINRKILYITSDTSMTMEIAYDAAQSGVTALNQSGLAKGFTIGTDADINASGEGLVYIAVM